MRRLMSVLLWSVIAGAFIGPGTVTTAAAVGAGFGLELVWALVFSTLACLVLQEAAARLTVASGHDLGEALRRRHRGLGGAAITLLVLGAIVVGCAAYEGGNVIGAVVGATIVVGAPRWLLALAVGGGAALLLWLGNPAHIARALSAVVGVMGIAFLVAAVGVRPSPAALVEGALVPAMPAGSGLLVLGLVGTTVVPYNLFLGSGLARGERLAELRFGLTVAIVLGGLISVAIVVVGSAVEGGFGFATLGAVLGQRLGPAGPALLGVGLLAAGFSSAVTAPLAAAVTARGLFGGRRWAYDGWRFRALALGVLAVGLAAGLADLRPVPAIVAAQALNGILLPLVAVFLLVAVNDRSLVGEAGLGGPLQTAVMTAVVATSLLLGVGRLVRASAGVLGAAPDPRLVLAISALAGLVLAVPVTRSVRRARSASAGES